MRKRLGVTLDIGTTTIQGKLIDLDEKSDLSYFSSLNEQLAHGHDIISRLKFCLEKANGLEKLQRSVVSSINVVIKNLLALYHFTLSLSPERLAKPPYEPEYKEFAKREATTLGIEVGRGCDFIFLPNIGGFVGSDAIAVILASGIDRSDSPMLAIDLGTNGEIVFGSKDKMWTASTAAGPAFEGWHISCGMRAVKGAIEAIEDRDGRLDLKVIGGVEPKGISGSGIVDIAAILLKRAQIDKSGSMKGEFVVYDRKKRISLSQDDIRQIQLAKAAFSTGIDFLRRLSKQDIAKLVITGNFGRSLNKFNAKTIGIIPPDIDLDKVEILENGALKGAEIFINEKEASISRVEEILQKTEHVPLNQGEHFQREFIKALQF